MRHQALSIALLLGAATASAAVPGVDSTCRRTTTDATPSTRTLRGTFDIQLTPQPATTGAEGSGIGRVLLRKQFRGGLEATGIGEMLAFRTATPGSAGYVAMERVEGLLDGCSGSFILMHTGEMTRGTPKLSVQVVPDSGTGELAGLSGALSIEVREGTHFYEFSYQLPGK